MVTMILPIQVPTLSENMMQISSESKVKRDICYRLKKADLTDYILGSV
jgi:hypothetical protein